MDQQQMLRALAALWDRHQPEIAERVAVLERACASLRAGKLSEEERISAASAAHKLAGVLGTFGRTRGTELSRSMESWLSSEAEASQHLSDLCSAVSELREIIR